MVLTAWRIEVVPQISLPIFQCHSITLSGDSLTDRALLDNAPPLGKKEEKISAALLLPTAMYLSSPRLRRLRMKQRVDGQRRRTALPLKSSSGIRLSCSMTFQPKEIWN